MRTLAATGVVAIAALMLTSCAGTAAPVTTTSTSAPSTRAALPPGVSVDVYRTRTDPGQRKLEIAVSNLSDSDLTITAVAFQSSHFVSPASWSANEGGSRVPAGFTIDFPVVLAPPRCDAGEATHTVRIEFVTADGVPGTATVPAIDRHDVLPGINERECLTAAAERITALEITGLELDTAEGDLIGHVVVQHTPTTASGQVRIERLNSTVLLKLVDPATRARVDELHADIAIRGIDAPGAFIIPIAPSRCDPHAIAEDKRGTFFDLDVAVDTGDAPERTGRITLASPDEVRAAIYAFFAESCGLAH